MVFPNDFAHVAMLGTFAAGRDRGSTSEAAVCQCKLTRFTPIVVALLVRFETPTAYVQDFTQTPLAYYCLPDAIFWCNSRLRRRLLGTLRYSFICCFVAQLVCLVPNNHTWPTGTSRGLCSEESATS
ncbi:hypothetical protein T265_02517 [Opisthorchis viverrini]|uniref:Uncharacterized protein n=1 Tax=Opisthorchis viverrini TaxID=6198 RepID=A0A074ZYZ6_OPIVI|nr:hypothetical protein T265_02517 [Opisthorchis viverrini]KER31192.1 hypothetical protein T265_02517 [Opisthorchis viverrini]